MTANAAYLEKARKIAVEIAKDYGGVTIESVTTACPVPEDVDKNVLGTIFNNGEWRKVNQVRSLRPEAKRRLIWAYIPANAPFYGG